MKRRSVQAVSASVVATILFILTAPSRAQSNNDLSAFVGRWKIDLSRTYMNRGNNISRSPSFTFVFSPQSPGLKLDIYADYPQPAPTRSNPIVPDHKLRSCQTSTGCLTVGGNPTDQSFAYFQIDPHMLIRVFYEKGKVSEYSTYTVSVDGKTFTMIAWGAEAPDRQNVQVFEKQP